jgi:hypothetical protein
MSREWEFVAVFLFLLWSFGSVCYSLEGGPLPLKKRAPHRSEKAADTSLDQTIRASSEKAMLIEWDDGFIARVTLFAICSADESNRNVDEYRMWIEEMVEPKDFLLGNLRGVEISSLAPPKEIRGIDGKLLWKRPNSLVSTKPFKEQLCLFSGPKVQGPSSWFNDIDRVLMAMIVSDKSGAIFPKGENAAILKEIQEGFLEAKKAFEMRQESSGKVIQRLEPLYQKATELSSEPRKIDPGFRMLASNLKSLIQALKATGVSPASR